LIPVPSVDSGILGTLVQILQHQKGIAPRIIQSPIRLLDMNRIVRDHWDASFVQGLDCDHLFRLAEAREIYLGARLAA
jgi:hypothetical protein